MFERPGRAVALIAIVLFFFWLLAPDIAALMYELHADPRLSELASFGDSFAVFNGLISSLALAVIAALFDSS